MTDRELMQMVLKKLDHIWELGVEVESYRLSDDLLPEMKALRDRLAQPEPKPIAWVHHAEGYKMQVTQHSPEPPCKLPDGFKTIPVYSNPPKREWVGLTDEEIDVAVKSCNTVNTYKYFRAIEAKLKEKNS